MGIFDITYSLQVSRLLPPSLRSIKITAMVQSLLAPLQDLSNRSIKYGRIGFVETTTNTTSDIILEPSITQWSNVTAYNKGDKVYLPFGAVYIANANNTGQQPDISSTWDFYVSDIFGYENLVKISGQKSGLEYILNLWCYGIYSGACNSTGLATNQIYITLNTVSIQNFHIGTTIDNSSLITVDNPKEYIGTIGTSIIVQYDFTINLPTGFPLLTQLTGVVNKYKLIGSTYNIVYY